MFSTFTGNSRRPRNVNLSGQTGNPFTNTSWNPSAVSNATKTVSDAQADREKRQIERQRQAAARNIQRIWRGHRAREQRADDQRSTFDDLYRSNTVTSPAQRLPIAFGLLLSFNRTRRKDDVSRALLLVRDFETVDVRYIVEGTQPSRLQRLVDILVQDLNILASQSTDGSSNYTSAAKLLNLIKIIVELQPRAITSLLGTYFTALTNLCRTSDTSILDVIGESMATILNQGQSPAYDFLAYQFLTSKGIALFESNIEFFGQRIDFDSLAKAILHGYSADTRRTHSPDDFLWLLAHFIDLGRVSAPSSGRFLHLNTLQTQLCGLSSVINGRIRAKPLSEETGDTSGVLEPYLARQLTSLVSYEGISKLLHDFSVNLRDPSSHKLEGTSLLAGYILALLQSFPNNADDTRMRLFLEQIPTDGRDTPIVVFLWQMMRRTTVFAKLKSETEDPVAVLRNYFQTSSHPLEATVEEQEWRIILLFLDSYTFILRLSDDDDFYSAMQFDPSQPSQPTSRLRACSLPQADLGLLVLFLKNTAFALHHDAQHISQPQRLMEASAKSHLDTYFGSRAFLPESSPSSVGSSRWTPAKLDIDSLRDIVTTALKMLHERNARKQFLPSEAWLMTHKLQQDDFINAVIAEEQRQIEEQEADESDDEESTTDDANTADSGTYSSFTIQRLTRHARMEQLKIVQKRMMKERRLAELGPKLEILKHMPFAVPFQTRVQIFRQFIQLDRARRIGGLDGFIHPLGRHHAKIRRGNLYEDAFQQLYGIGEGLKDQIQITFMDQFENPEAGIDGGGVTKEFLTSVTSEAFGIQDGSGMFVSNDKGLLYPNPAAMDMLYEELRREGFTEADEEWRSARQDLLSRYEFLGRIIGKCMYESILVDLTFAGFFLLKWPSPSRDEANRYKGGLNDLKEMDEELYKGLLHIKNIPDVASLDLVFALDDQVSGPGEPRKTASRNLVPNGDQKAVTNDDRLLYISYVARHRLVVQPSLQTSAFLKGIRAIIRPTWLSMFNQTELQRLVGGDPVPIDIEDLRRNTVCTGLYVIGDDGEDHPTIQLFWKVMRGFSDAQRRDLLRYVTSTPRAPLLGFSQLTPLFSIRDSGADETRLPSTSTCVNLLKLPLYKTEANLREKLLYAITSGAGFDLS